MKQSSSLFVFIAAVSPSAVSGTLVISAHNLICLTLHLIDTQCCCHCFNVKSLLSSCHVLIIVK